MGTNGSYPEYPGAGDHSDDALIANVLDANEAALSYAAPSVAPAQYFQVRIPIAASRCRGQEESPSLIFLFFLLCILSTLNAYAGTPSAMLGI